MTRAAAALGTLLPLVTAALVAQQPAAQPPVFRSGVDVTTIDVTVIARNGDPVPDLKPDDFVVTVDGKPRAVVSAQFLDLSGGAASGAPAAPARPEVSSNADRRGVRGRLIVLLVDQGNIRMGAERSVLHTAEGFLDRLLPSDRVALLTIPQGPVVSFTGDRERVKAGLRRIIGDYQLPTIRHNISAVESLLIEDGDTETLSKVIMRECAAGDPGCPQEIELEARSMAPQVRTRGLATIRALSDAFKFLKSIDGPKTVALVSEGLILDQQRFPQGLPPEVESLAVQARATVYVLRLHPEDFDATDVKPIRAIDTRAQTIGLETIAGVTGGELLTVVGTGASIFDRISRELSGQYLLGIETSDRDRDGKPHRIKVTVRRGRLEVRSRRAFEADPVQPRPGDMSVSAAILGALRSPLLQSGLPIRASSYTLLDADRSKVRVVVAAEIGEGMTQPTKLAIGYEITDAGGTVITGHAGAVTLTPGADGRVKYRESWSLAPGDYTFKIAVADAAGKVGSLDRPLAAALKRVGPITLADVVISGERATDLDVEPVVAPGRITCAIDMRTEPGALPDKTTVVVDIADRAGATVTSVPVTLVSSADGVRHVARGSADVSTLAGGTYVARVTVTAPRLAGGVLTRTFRLVR